MAEKHLHHIQNPLSRHDYLYVVRTGLQAKQYNFVRQAALNWLGKYPGDLEMGLVYAHALAGEGHYGLALQISTGLSMTDPEYREALVLAVELIHNLKQIPEPSKLSSSEIWQKSAGSANIDFIERESSVLAHLFALSGNAENAEISASWGAPLWIARQAMQRSDYSLAEQLIAESFSQGGNHPLIGALHLELLSSKPGVGNQQMLDAGQKYSQRWPDTLQIMLRYADCLLQAGRSDQAVSLLHQAASRDVAGQVAKRIWGSEHVYRTLWSDSMQTRLNIMVPAIVTAVLGWNRLPSGEKQQVVPEPRISVQKTDTDLKKPVVVKSGSNSDQNPLTSEFVRLIAQEISDPSSKSGERDLPSENNLQQVQKDLQKLAKYCKAPEILRRDGRFPVYVIYSSRSRLQKVYGVELSSLIENEMILLAEALQSRPGWAGRVFFADDPVDTVSIGSKPVKLDDAWNHKLLISDLDEALAKHGERIGALLIVGGPEIVPFHLLPNPVDDADQEVESDNPYATRDKNYFLPEWPVGRLPGGVGADASLILSALNRFTKFHIGYQRKLPWHQKLHTWFRSLGSFLKPASRSNFGYSAEIWQQAAGNVFRLIGRSSAMHISPPYGMVVLPGEDEAQIAQGLKGIPIPFGKLAYYNLHGVAYAVEWFGHRDLLTGSNGPDFPIALRPEDIRPHSNKSLFPEVVFSEACYGMLIQDRTVDQSIALKFLEAGSQAVIGATCMSYGAVANTTLFAADLLGYTFWRFLKGGMPVGEALRQAKIYLVSEMQKRQGYLDGEDQKTAISFILYGDPLAEPYHLTRVPKSIRYQTRSSEEIFTVSDRMDSPREDGPVPPEVMKGVQRAVARYLPGMKDARLAYVCEHPSSSNTSQTPIHTHETTGLPGRSDAKKGGSGSPNRNLIMLSKDVARHGEIHPMIARLTLDDHGQLVKLVVSR